MEETKDDDRFMTGRFYTSARRFKQVLGSLPDGTKIPGGPYTYTQIGVMLGTLVLGWLTRGVWGSGSAIGDLIILIAIAVGAGFVVAKLPTSRRSPLRLLGSTFALLTHPGPGGRWDRRHGPRFARSLKPLVGFHLVARRTGEIREAVRHLHL